MSSKRLSLCYVYVFLAKHPPLSVDIRLPKNGCKYTYYFRSILILLVSFVGEIQEICFCFEGNRYGALGASCSAWMSRIIKDGYLGRPWACIRVVDGCVLYTLFYRLVARGVNRHADGVNDGSRHKVSGRLPIHVAVVARTATAHR